MFRGFEGFMGQSVLSINIFLFMLLFMCHRFIVIWKDFIEQGSYSLFAKSCFPQNVIAMEQNKPN